jgi:hypothetical protein
VIYVQSYLDLKKDGPLVVVAPPGLIGMFTDWQRALTDVGIGGPDKGQGGLYLLPPDYDGAEPHNTYRSQGPDMKQAVAHISRRSSLRCGRASPANGRKCSFRTPRACRWK